MASSIHEKGGCFLRMSIKDNLLSDLTFAAEEVILPHRITAVFRSREDLLDLAREKQGAYTVIHTCLTME